MGAFDSLQAMPCPPGFAPQVHFDGGTSTVIMIDDPGAQVGLNLGVLVNFGAAVGADWVATKVTQNSVCTFGCFAACNIGQDAPRGTRASCTKRNQEGPTTCRRR